jgi:processive 1,2-diacylglycerol beta-glucosyltransferase
MIPHGFAAHAIPSSRTDGSAPLTGSLDLPPRDRRSEGRDATYPPPSCAEEAEALSSLPVRVLVLTAPVGDGHVAAARTLSEDIGRRNVDAQVEICDVLPALRAPLRWLLNDAYRWQLHAAPWLFGALFGALRRSRLLRRLTRAGLSLAGSRGLLRLVDEHSADVIVSTWPVATTILGCLRLRDKVRAPVCATITDFAGLELWADRGVDLHLVMHESLVPKVERLAGRDSARHVSPLVAREFLAPRSSAEARRRLGLPAEGIVVVVSGGGWAVGDLSGAVETALQVEGSTVLCLAGRDDATRARLELAFRDEPRAQVLGFTDRMDDLLAAADVLVHSTGGVTSLEALARGCPIVAYGAPQGHAPLLAREMASLGLVEHARSTTELKTALLAAPTTPRTRLLAGIDGASLVLALTPRVVASLRARLARTAATAASVAVLLFAFLASDLTYPMVAEALALPDSTSISTDRHAVALVIRGQLHDLLALSGTARRIHLRVSVAVTGSPTALDVARLRRSGLDPIPELRARGVASWFEASRQIEEQRVRYGLGRSFYYVAPDDGFTLTDYLLARRLGGEPVQGRTAALTDGRELSSLRPGEIVVATLDSDRLTQHAALLATIRRIERAGLEVSSVQRLAAAQAGP